jgi:predicted nucleic acid-binding protein
MLLYADELLLEYREKFIAREIESELRIAFLASLNAMGERVEIRPGQIEPIVSADPDDDVVIACASIGKATHLVTYDPHLLNLGKSYRGIVILNGLHFLYLVRGDTPPD